MFGKNKPRESQIQAVTKALNEEEQAFRKSSTSKATGRAVSTLMRAEQNASPAEMDAALKRHRRQGGKS